MIRKQSILLLAAVLLGRVPDAEANRAFEPLFDGRQSHVEVAAESSLSRFPAKSKIVVHLKNPRSFPLCIPDFVLPANGHLNNRSVDVLDDGGRRVEYVGALNDFAPPFDRMFVIPVGYTADIEYFLGESYQLVAGRRYSARIKVDAFDCTALEKGYVFPQWKPASEWTATYRAPAVDLDPSQMLTFEAEVTFVAD